MSEKYTSKSGVTIEIIPVAYYKLQQVILRIERGYRERGEPVDPPTYVTTVGIGSETAEEIHVHEHVLDENGEIVNSTLSTPEEHDAWKRHKDVQAKIANETAMATLKFALQNGILVDMSQNDGWESDHRYYGIDVPEDPRDKKFHYIMSEVLVTPQEQQEVSMRILMKSINGVDPEVEESVSELFRSQVEKQTNKRTANKKR